MRTWEIQLFLKAAKSRAEKFIKENYPAVHQSIPDFLPFESENEGFKTAIARIEEFRWGWSTTLNLSNLNLTSLPEELFRLGNRFESIDLSGNKITTIPDGFKSLAALKEVNLSRNRISSVPSCMDSMPSLEKIDLTNNPIPFLSNHVIKIDSEGVPEGRITSSELKNKGRDYVKEIALNKFKDKIALDSGSDFGGPSRIFTTEICESFMKHANLTDNNKIPRLPESAQLDDFTLYALFLSKLYNLESIPLKTLQSKVNRTTGYHLHENFFSVVKIFLRDDHTTQEKKDLFLDAYLKIHTDRGHNLVLIEFMRDPVNEEKKAKAKDYLNSFGENIDDTDLIELSFSHFAHLYLPTLAFSQGVAGNLKNAILNSANDGKEILKNLQGETITAEKLIQKINFDKLPSRYSDALKQKITQEGSDGESSSWVKDFVSFLTGSKTLPTNEIKLSVNTTRDLSAHTCNMSLDIPESMVTGQAAWPPLNFIEALSSVINGVSLNSL
jgi:Leucine-rich repeat (LRR) protein